MTDEPHPEHELPAEVTMASASVDGVLTPDELAQAQASTEVQALARSFTDLRSRLADISDLAADTARDAAIGAALAEFDTIHAAPAVGADVAPVVDIAAHRRWPARLLAAAAVVALLGVAGVAVFGGNGGDGGSKSSTALPEGRTQAGDVVGGAPQSTIGAINAAADPRLSITDPRQLHDLQPAATDRNGAQGPTSLPPSVDGKYAAVPCLGPHQIFLALIFYDGKPAIAVRDTVTGVTQAIDDQCHVLVEVRP